MSAVLFTIASIAAAAGTWMLLRRLQSDEIAQPALSTDTTGAERTAKAAAEAKVTREMPAIGYVGADKPAPVVRTGNPTYAAAKGLGNVWELNSEASCRMAETFGKRRLATDDTVVLAAPNCMRMDCQCYYKALPDLRRGFRRDSSDRREQFRVSRARVERRRMEDRRRTANKWADRKHY